VLKESDRLWIAKQPFILQIKDGIYFDDGWNLDQRPRFFIELTEFMRKHNKISGKRYYD